MKTIEDYTTDELSSKINAIKAEREKTANALKKYEEELERRKNKNWLPLEDVLYSAKYESADVLHVELKLETTFNNYSCFYKYRDFGEAINKALVANAKGEPIDIQVLLPLLKKGKVLYSPYDEKWKWVEQEAIVFAEEHGWYIKKSQVLPIEGFNLKPADNWENSVMECGL